MRLLDKIISMGPPEFRKLPDSLVAFSVDEIANYYAQSEKSEWGSDDYPYGKPPWNCCFVEWNEPPRMLFPHGWEDNPLPGTQSGCFCMNASNEPDQLFPAIRGLARSNGVEIPDDPKFHAPETTASALCLFPFVSPRGAGAKQLGWNTIIYLNEDGRDLGNFSYGPNLGSVSESDQHLMTSRNVHICMLAFTFSNCSNVKLLDSTSELEPSPKLKRRLRIPTIKRYTLEIAGHAATSRRSSDGQSEAVMPFHLCRGHFATYTDDSKLFGKYTGRFWIPPHTRGKKELGEIVKDYAVA